MAVKKRVIWVSDEDWAALGAQAKEQGTSISRILTGAQPRRPGGDQRPATMADVEAYVRKLAVPAFRPVPKPQKKPAAGKRRPATL